MKIIFFVFILGMIVSPSTFSQAFSKKYFVNTKWFTGNIDSTFFKNDTLTFIKYSNLESKYRNYKFYKESEIELLGHGEYIILQFNKYGNMHFWQCYYHQSTKSGIGERSWKYDQSTNTLRTYYHSKQEFIFNPLYDYEIQFIRDYQNYSDTMSTIKLVLLRKD